MYIVSVNDPYTRLAVKQLWKTMLVIEGDPSKSTGCCNCYTGYDDTWHVELCPQCDFRLFCCPKCMTGEFGRYRKELIDLHVRDHVKLEILARKIKSDIENRAAEIERRREKARKDRENDPVEKMNEQARRWLIARKKHEPHHITVEQIWTRTADYMTQAGLAEPDEQSDPVWPDMPRYLDILQTTDMLHNGKRCQSPRR